MNNYVVNLFLFIIFNYISHSSVEGKKSENQKFSNERKNENLQIL